MLVAVRGPPSNSNNEHKSLGTVKVLLQAGADKNLKQGGKLLGKTAKALAKKEKWPKNHEIHKLLA